MFHGDFAGRGVGHIEGFELAVEGLGPPVVGVVFFLSYSVSAEEEAPGMVEEKEIPRPY